MRWQRAEREPARGLGLARGRRALPEQTQRAVRQHEHLRRTKRPRRRRTRLEFLAENKRHGVRRVHQGLRSGGEAVVAAATEIRGTPQSSASAPRETRGGDVCAESCASAADASKSLVASTTVRQPSSESVATWRCAVLYGTSPVSTIWTVESSNALEHRSRGFSQNTVDRPKASTLVSTIRKCQRNFQRRRWRRRARGTTASAT